MHNCLSLDVRPYECDGNGHVNHAVFVNYLELGRLAFLRQIHFDYEGMLAQGHFVFIHHLDIHYLSQARLGDSLLITSQPRQTRRVSGLFHQTIHCGHRLVIDANAYWCVVNAAGRPHPPPPPFDFRAHLAAAAPRSEN